jgi:hypothetical protein
MGPPRFRQFVREAADDTGESRLSATCPVLGRSLPCTRVALAEPRARKVAAKARGLSDRPTPSDHRDRDQL